MSGGPALLGFAGAAPGRARRRQVLAPVSFSKALGAKTCHKVTSHKLRVPRSDNTFTSCVSCRWRAGERGDNRRADRETIVWPCQNLAHALDEFALGREKLGALAQFEIIGAVLGRLRELGPKLEIADRDLRAARRVALVSALDHGDAAPAPVRIFELRVHLAVAEIEFGRDPRLAQARDELLIVRHRIRIAVEGEHDDGAGRLGRGDNGAFDGAQGREQPRDPDRKAGRGNRLLAEARDEAVIAPAAADRAEADRPAVVVLDLEGELRLEDGAGVIFEPAYYGRVDA